MPAFSPLASTPLAAEAQSTLSGQAAATEGADALAAVAVVSSTGAAAIIEKADTALNSGLISWAGAANITEQADTSASAGTIVNVGSAAITEQADAGAGSGAVVNLGLAAIVEQSDTSASSGTIYLLGAAAIVEQADTGAGLGYISYLGAAAIIEQADTSAASGVALTFGSAAITEQADTAVASGSVNAVDSDAFLQTGFPPAKPTALQHTIPSYLYVEYQDDDALQALFSAYNQLAQQYLTTINGLDFGNYSNPNITGDLLTWVAQGVFGMKRPYLPAGAVDQVGDLGTYEFGQVEFGEFDQNDNTTYYATSDDIFKRILTWSYYKGDGKQFSVKWLKRRVTRFLFGANGKDVPVADTYRVSVSFGLGNQINITVPSVQSQIDDVTFGSFEGLFGGFEFNQFSVTETPLPSIPTAPILKAAIDSGVLPLPFQYTYVVDV